MQYISTHLEKSKAWNNTKGQFVMAWNAVTKEIECEKDGQFFYIPLHSARIMMNAEAKEVMVVDLRKMQHVILRSISISVMNRIAEYFHS